MIWLAFLLWAQDAAALSQQGAAAMRAGRFAEAEAIYRTLQERDPANPTWGMNRGIVLHSMARYADAIVQLEAFLKRQPQPGPVHLLVGLSQLKLQQPCRAIPPLEKALVWNATRTVIELADAYYGCKRFEAAAKLYEKAWSSTHQKPEVARQAAHCYWQARLYPNAKRLYAAVNASFAQDPEYAYEYGDTLARVDGPEAGLPLLEQAVNANPGLLPARGELGKALLALNRASEAVRHLEAASPADPALLLPLSRAYRAVGRRQDAEHTQAEYRKRVSQAGNDK